MAYQSLNLGSIGDDGTGDSMRAGGDKINDNFSEIYTLLGTGTELTTGMSATRSVVRLTAATVATSIAPSSSDGASLGTASLEWSDLYIADAGQILFGDDQEITLTHVHNVGLTLTHVTASDNLPMVLQLKSEEDAIIASEVIASLEFAAGDSDGTDGATVAAGIHAIAEGTFSSSANATKLVFTTGVSETAAASATAKMTLSSAGLLTLADDLVIKDGGTIGVTSSAAAITIASSGIVTLVDDLVLKDAATIGVASSTSAITIASSGIVTFVDDILIKDGGTIGAASSTGAITIASSGIVTFVDDILIKDGGTIGSASAATAITVASSGIVTLVDDLMIKDGGTIGVASVNDAMTISSGGIVTFKDDIVIKDGGTIGTSTTAAALTVASGGGVTFSAAPVFPDGSINIADLDIDGGTDIGEAIVDADLFVIDNGAGGTNRKTTAARVKSYIGGGGLVPITHYSPSSATALDIEDFSATYEMYHIYFHNILFDSTADIEFRFKIGGSYIDSSDYVFQTQYNAMAGNDPTQTNQSGRDAMKFGIGGRDDITGCMTVYAVNGTTSNARASFVGFIGTLYAAESFWVLANTGAVQGVKVICGGGMTGKISIFGVVNA